MKTEAWIGALLSAMLGVLFALTAILLFASCAPSSPAEPEFAGRWAADSAGPGIVAMEFNSDGSSRLSAFADGKMVSEARGDWDYQSPRLIVRHTQCQSGSPLVLVSCSPPDTLRPADISGDVWRVSFLDAGEIITYNFRRVN